MSYQEQFDDDQLEEWLDHLKNNGYVEELGGFDQRKFFIACLEMMMNRTLEGSNYQGNYMGM